jgi:3-isopropylmalate/(R)-2-methylmalate dehydratase small subunit
MKPFTTLTSKVIPLPRKDVDTDLIIPAQFLTSTSRGGYGPNLFRRLRDEDPQFPLNDPRYNDAQILVAESNFGCGSSREHAVWAIREAGIRVVIAPSFADIFFGNSAKNGLLLVQLSESVVATLLSDALARDVTLTVSLDAQSVLYNGTEHSFSYDPFRKHCLQNGLEDLDYLMTHKEEIKRYFESQR